VLAYFNVDVIN